MAMFKRYGKIFGIGIALILIAIAVFAAKYPYLSRELIAILEGEESETKRLEEELHEMQARKERTDRPDEAAEFSLLKRLPLGTSELPIEKYLEALELMKDLPQYSIAGNDLLASRRKLNATNPGFQLDTWKSIGPGNMGGRVRALVINPQNPGVMYAAAAAGGVWKSVDDGKIWKPLTDLLANLAVNALAIDPQNPEVLYAGTGEGYFNSDALRGAGIFKSFDGGASWRRLESTATPDFYYVNDIVVSPTKSNQLYTATRNGVFRSADSGSTWTPMSGIDRINGGCLDLVIRTDQPVGRDYLFASCGTAVSSAQAGVQASIYRHINAAAGLSAWELVHTEPGMGRTSLAIAPSNQNVIYAASSESGATGRQHSLHAVHRSTNAGAPESWIARVRGNDPNSKKLHTVLFSNPIYAFLSECQLGISQYFSQGWYDNAIAVDPKDENSVWVGGIDLFRSNDGGENWGQASFWHLSRKNPHYVHADQHSIVFHPQFDGATNKNLFVTNDGGVYMAQNADAQIADSPCEEDQSRLSWVSLNNGLEVTQFYHGAVFPDGTRYLGGTQDNGVIQGSDEKGGNEWREMLSGDGGYVVTAPGGAIYASSTGLSIKRSTDNGQAFTPATTGISNSGFLFIAPLILDPGDANRLWTGGRQLWRTRDGARNWIKASPDLQGSVSSIAIAESDSNFVLAGTCTGSIHRTTIGLNADADSFWPYAVPRNGFVSGVAFDPSNRDIAYATYSTFGGKHVWRSVDGGISWRPIDGSGAGSLPDIPVNCILVDPTNTQRLFIGTDLGVFVSTDGGGSWAVENNGFANAPIHSMMISSLGKAGYLYAFTHGRGAWRVPLGGGCVYSMSPSGLMAPVEGDRLTIAVATSRGECAWNAESKAPWIRIASGANGQGEGSVTLEIAENKDSKQRNGIITIAGKSVTIMQAGPTTSVSAASLLGSSLAPASIVSAFGAGLSPAIRAATTTTLPTALANTVVTVTDSKGARRSAPLFFVSPTQVNYQMPEGTAEGNASVMIINGNEGLFTGSVRISMVAPGLFTANASGRGPAVGNALLVRSDGSRKYDQISRWDGPSNRFISNPIDLGALGDQVYLILYGTGVRYRSSLSAVSATIDRVLVPVLFAGPQEAFAGLDQINILLPRELAGRGEVDLSLIVDGTPANTIRISLK
jgi:uncharacterized protein (TIGR03437 family)